MVLGRERHRIEPLAVEVVAHRLGLRAEAEPSPAVAVTAVVRSASAAGVGRAREVDRLEVHVVGLVRPVGPGDVAAAGGVTPAGDDRRVDLEAAAAAVDHLVVSGDVPVVESEVVARVRDVTVGPVGRIGLVRHAHLPQVVLGDVDPRVVAGLADRRQQHADEQRDDRHDHQQLDDGETLPGGFVHASLPREVSGPPQDQAAGRPSQWPCAV